MTTYLEVNLSDERIAAMEPFDAYHLAEHLMDSRMPREAARVLRRVVEVAGEHSGAWELMGRAYYAAALLRPAEDAFRKLIELEPTSAWAHTALGLTLDRQSKHSEATRWHRIADALGGDGSRATFAPRATD